MDAFGLDAFLSDIRGRDDYLKEAPSMPASVLPPVRGAPDVQEITPAVPAKKKQPKAPPAPPKDEADIWDASEVPVLPSTTARPTSAPTGGMRKVAIMDDDSDSDEEEVPIKKKGASAEPVKARQRKHAYEYFNQ